MAADVHKPATSRCFEADSLRSIGRHYAAAEPLHIRVSRQTQYFIFSSPFQPDISFRLSIFDGFTAATLQLRLYFLRFSRPLIRRAFARRRYWHDILLYFQYQDIGFRWQAIIRFSRFRFQSFSLRPLRRLFLIDSHFLWYFFAIFSFLASFLRIMRFSYW